MSGYARIKKEDFRLKAIHSEGFDIPEAKFQLYTKNIGLKQLSYMHVYNVAKNA